MFLVPTFCVTLKNDCYYFRGFKNIFVVFVLDILLKKSFLASK